MLMMLVLIFDSVALCYLHIFNICQFSFLYKAYFRLLSHY